MELSNNQIQILQKLLSNLESHTELEATAVVTIEGMRVACAVSGDVDADVYSAASAALVNLGETTLKQLQHGSLKEIIVRGDAGYTILTRAGRSYMVIGSCKIGSRMGYYLALLHRFCNKVGKIVDPNAPSVEKQAAPVVSTKHYQADKRYVSQEQIPSISSPTSQPVKPRSPQIPLTETKDKEAIESALDALSMLEETEPPSSISTDEPVQLTTQSSNDSIDLDDALKTLGASEEPTSSFTVDVNTDALVDALKPAATPQKRTTVSSPPFTTSSESTTATSSSNDIFNISDKEAVLEALKVLGWSDDTDSDDS